MDDELAIFYSNQAVAHDSRIRCPQCGHTWVPQENPIHYRPGASNHGVGCPRCGHNFTILVEISMTFYSPAREPMWSPS